MGQDLRQVQSQRLGFRQIQAVELLALSNEQLGEYLSERVAQNPLLRLRAPRGAAAALPDQAAAESGLYAHVMAQLPLIIRARGDHGAALALTEALEPGGWITRPPALIAAQHGIALADLLRVLALLQKGIDPAGLFARNLTECLALQAEDRGELDQAMAALLADLEAVPGGLQPIARHSGIALAALERAFARMRRYAPCPGLAFSEAPAPLREPDVIVARDASGWRITLNRSTLPALEIAPASPALSRAAAEARDLFQALRRRNHMVLTVVRAVLRHQPGYLREGPPGLRRLNRSDIADRLGLHPTTVGRVTQGLLLDTPYGFCALADLFTPERGSPDLPAPRAVQARLAELVAQENTGAPLSDQQLCDLLAAEGKPLARRTVTKFRQQSGIPARHARRQAYAPSPSAAD